MKPSLYYPVCPVHVNQIFGANPEYYARFLDKFGKPEKGHMGIDFQASHGQPVYAAHDGLAIYIKDDHGGEGVYNYDYQNGFVTIYWHLIGITDTNFPPPIPFDFRSHSVKAGDLIGFADNTGAPFESSGDHLHFGLAFIDEHGNFLNPDNGYGGCVDPQTYFNGTCAANISPLISLYQQLTKTLQGILTLLKSGRVTSQN